MKPAILFDLDGTLWDSSREVAISWTQALLPYGLPVTQADVQAVMGKTMTEIAQLLFPTWPASRQTQVLEQCSDAELAYLAAHGALLYPDLLPTLETLSRDYFLAIVSNCQKGYIETFLNYYGLAPLFSDLESFGGTGLPKGENIRLVVQRNGLERALYVGDTQKDWQAAVSAGVPFVHAAYGFGTIDRPVPRLERLADLPALARTLL